MNALESKFAQTIKQHRSTIYTVCYMFSQDADEVNDLFQEALVNLWRGFEGFEHRSDIKTWIYRVSLNTCISIDRKKRRQATVPRTVMRTHARWICSTNVSPSSSPSTAPSCFSGWRN